MRRLARSRTYTVPAAVQGGAYPIYPGALRWAGSAALRRPAPYATPRCRRVYHYGAHVHRLHYMYGGILARLAQIAEQRQQGQYALPTAYLPASRAA